MTTPHDTPRWVYLGGKMVQAKPDAPDHDSSPLYVLARDHAALVERCRAMAGENADLKTSVVAFGAPWAVDHARRIGLPDGHLAPHHYDILERAGARMADFTRAALASGGRG